MGLGAGAASRGFSRFQGCSLVSVGAPDPSPSLGNWFFKAPVSTQGREVKAFKMPLVALTLPRSLLFDLPGEHSRENPT